MPAQVMGVLNVTPDSFSDGGQWLAHSDAIAHGQALFAQGADIVDVGGESTRPGALAVSVDEELERVIPVIEALSSQGVVSVDTSKPEVALAAVRAGASIINDVTASLFQVAADTGADWVAMHMQGSPRTMQVSPVYQDVVSEVAAFLVDKAEAATRAGVKKVWIDPGIGFGKTLQHNLSLLRSLSVLSATGYPVVVGTSRKSFIGTLLADGGSPVPADQRVEGSLASALWSITNGASIVRVHDVKETVRAAKVLAAIQEAA